MPTRLLLRFALAAFFVSVFTMGCGSEGGGTAGNGGKAVSPACATYCHDVCTQLAACPDADTKDCQTRCAAGLDAATCSQAEPADRMTCHETEELVACSSYCDAVCARGAKCGSFDEAACRKGCLIDPPSVCNPKSVPPRTCDELKFEVGCYEEVGNETGGCGGTDPFCTSNDECGDFELRGVCNLETNLCEPCTTEASCNPSAMSSGYVYVCNTDKRCERVDCLQSSDCDSSLRAVCDTAAHACVECVENADCGQAVLGKLCDKAEHSCVECLTNDDCGSGNTCDPDLHYCSFGG